jgi:uncharacterized membrane protein
LWQRAASKPAPASQTRIWRSSGRRTAASRPQTPPGSWDVPFAATFGETIRSARTTWLRSSTEGRPAERLWPLAIVLFAATCLVPGIGLLWAYFDALLYTHVGVQLRAGAIPYRDFDLEYPPGALVAFVIPALAESLQYDTAFKLTQAAFGAGCVACVGVIGRAIDAPPRRLLAATGLAALAPLLLGPVSLVRFDLWPAFVVAAALAALVLGHPRIALALLAFAATVKVYPLALLPIALLYIVRRWGRREAAVGAAIWMAVGIAVLLPFLLIAPEGVRYSAHWHLDRGLQLETVPGAALALFDAVGFYDATITYRSGAYDFVGSLPDAVAALQTLGLVVSVIAVALLFARSSRSSTDLTVAAAATVVITLVFAKVLSPQFLLWLVPLVPLALTSGAAVVMWSVFGCMLLLTHAFYPSSYAELVKLEPFPVVMLVARNVLLVELAVLLVLRLRRPR